MSARDPAADAAAVQRIHDAARSGRHADAAALAQAALTDGLEHPLVLNLAALTREQEGRFADAAALLHRAVNLDPADVGTRNALGLCLLNLDRPEEALAQFKAVIDLDATLPFAHASHGNASFALGRVADAEASYRRALALDPRQAVALCGLAHIAVRRGDYPEARAFATGALEGIPGFPDAVMTLAAADLGQRDLSGAESRVRKLLADPRLSRAERAYAEGLLGDVLDAADRTDEAFAAYQRCNDELRRIHAARFSSEVGACEYTRSLQAAFERVPTDAWPPGSVATPDTGAAGHVFLLGFPRSGAGLLEAVLGSHRDVVSVEGAESMIDGIRRYLRNPLDLGALAAADSADLQGLREAYWRRVAAAGIDVAGKIFIDRNPLHTQTLPLIYKLFPASKILFACRDPRDVVLSAFRLRFTMNSSNFELLSVTGAAQYYDAVMQFAVRCFGTLPLDVRLVRHEDVVTDFRREMRRICAFIGIEWDPGMGDVALRRGDERIAAPRTAQLVAAFNTEGVGQWRRYQAQLAPVMPTLDPWIRRFYYDDPGVMEHPPTGTSS